MARRNKTTTVNNTTNTTTTHTAPKNKRPWHHPLVYTLLFLFGLAELGLIAHLVHLSNTNQIHYVHQVRRRYKYTLFVAVWTVLLSLVFLGIAMATFLFRWMHHVAFLVLTTIFWLIAAAMLQSRIGKFLDHTPYCSSFIGKGHCNEMRASLGIAWILFVLSLLAIPLFFIFRHKERQDIRHRSDPSGQAMSSQTGLAPATTYGHANLTPAAHAQANTTPGTQGHHVTPATTHGVPMRPVVQP